MKLIIKKKQVKKILIYTVAFFVIILPVIYYGHSNGIVISRLKWDFELKKEFRDKNNGAEYCIEFDRYGKNKIAITLSGNCYDLSALVNFDHLGRLYIKDCPIKNLLSLRGLNVEELCIGDGVPIESLQGIEGIWVNDLYIFDPSRLDNLSALYNSNIQFLHMPGAQKLKDISPLSTMQSLVYLHIPYADIVDVSALKKNNRLKILDIAFTKVESIGPLRNLTLERLSIEGTPAAHKTIPHELKKAVDDGYLVKYR